MYKMILAAVIAIAFTSCEPQEKKADKYWVYVASDNAEDGAGIGIYDWVPEIGVMSSISADTQSATSSYLAVDTVLNTLYNVNGEGIFAYQINRESGALMAINNTRLTGRGPCHISVSNDHKFVLVGYYSSGSLAAYEIKEDGGIGAQLSGFEHRGSSVNAERQERAHVHMVSTVPESNLVLVPDLGIDKVVVYALDDTGTLTPAEDEYVARITPGGGPRHLAIHPSNKFVYVLHELTGHVTGFGLDPQNGFRDSINTISTLPADFAEFNKSADIHITPNGQYLYASNRGHNSLVVCEISQETGALTVLGTKSCGGDWPRAFGIDPTGQYIFVANKRSDQISLLKIDYATGFFEKTGEVKTQLAPQGIRFIKAK
ncbi:MAG: lactonase family protein [Cyclobacteriaceae bacterium]